VKPRRGRFYFLDVVAIVRLGESSADAIGMLAGPTGVIEALWMQFVVVFGEQKVGMSLEIGAM
jgi:hypothetical protein